MSDGERSLLVHLRSNKEIWKLKFADRQIRDMWADMVEKKRREDIHRSLSNAEMRMSELESRERLCQSESIQIFRKKAENQAVLTPAESAINLGELQNRIVTNQ